jgi:general secretion pathway protein D
MPFAFGGLNSSSLVIPQISYATVGLNLEITAVIDHDSIRLHVVPVLNTLTQFVSIAVQGVGTFQEPEIASRALSSDILTRSNYTIIMGGLISNTISKQEYTIPFLGAIPGLKYLFSGYNDVRTVDEMVFIITPIVSDGFSVPEPTTRTLLHLKPEQAPLRTIPQKESTHITAGQM